MTPVVVVLVLTAFLGLFTVVEVEGLSYLDTKRVVIGVSDELQFTLSWNTGNDADGLLRIKQWVLSTMIYSAMPVCSLMIPSMQITAVILLSLMCICLISDNSNVILDLKPRTVVCLL